jgi:L-lactate dehydrogenase complex protein LldE
MRVQLFVTCIIDSLFPHVGEAVVSVLERLGVEVVFAEAQTCCGQPGYNAGFRPEARRLALNVLDLFETSSDPIVTPSGSCTAMLIHGYADLFADDPPNLRRARALAARAYELSQFLVEVLKVDPAAVAGGARLTGRVAYHASCHLARGLGVREPPLRLLDAVPGAEVVSVAGADECCGFGGLFSVKHADVSAAMLDKKLANIRASHPAALVSGDMSCLMHLAGGLRRDGSAIECLHLAEVLAATRADHEASRGQRDEG